MPNTNAKEERRAPQVPSPRSFDLTQLEEERKKELENGFFTQHLTASRNTLDDVVSGNMCGEGAVYTGSCC